ncbi:MAG: 1,4-dihydroxy-2-naphthoyl-CoA synthase [Propionibacteriaceae bacterium]|nr:1,4-dihydroxy-2-naphthoyl-CoA synthase [Propionibacteriaceae bacterium]
MENPFDPNRWENVPGFAFTDISYHRAKDVPCVRIAFNRPEVRNAFRPHTVDELYLALDHARTSAEIGCVLLTGNGPSSKDGGWAFCSGGDQRIRGRSGYQYEAGALAEDGAARARAEHDTARATVDQPYDNGAVAEDDVARATRSQPSADTGTSAVSTGEVSTSQRAALGHLHILEVQRLIRFMPKVVIALVNGWAAGGGHSLHVVCDLSLASLEHARFKQTDADVGSFDAGFGSAYLARQVGQKFAREIFFLGDTYSAQDAYRMGMVNAVVPHADLETTGLGWAAKICGKSPTAQRMLKFAFNAIDDGLIGQQVFAGETTRLAYMTDEAVEGRDAFLEKRPPDWSNFPYYY